jgi:hypothetical protein
VNPNLAEASALRTDADFSAANSVESLLGANARRYQGAIRVASPVTRLHALRTEPRTGGQVSAEFFDGTGDSGQQVAKIDLKDIS